MCFFSLMFQTECSLERSQNSSANILRKLSPRLADIFLHQATTLDLHCLIRILLRSNCQEQERPCTANSFTRYQMLAFMEEEAMFQARFLSHSNSFLKEVLLFSFLISSTCLLPGANSALWQDRSFHLSECLCATRLIESFPKEKDRLLWPIRTQTRPCLLT